MHKQSDERGVVSILTVLFFVILLSVLTIAFLRIMSDEQEQTLGDDLTKGALASAQSGVEDAKRALLYCHTATGADKASCDAELNSTSCPGIFAGGFLKTQLGVGADAAGVVQVGNTTTYNQRYTCLIVHRETSDAQGKTQGDGGLSNMIELNTQGSAVFDEVVLSWHRNGQAYDGTSVQVPSAATNNGQNLQTPNWKSAGPGTPYPAVLRVQLLEYDPTANLDTLAQRQLSYFLLPSASGSDVTVGGPIDNTLVPQTGSALRREVFCSPSNALVYACEAALKGITGVDLSGGKRYFLRISSLYRTTNYKVELKRLGTAVKLFDVQPEIDATGVANDTYRRVISRVEYGAVGGYYPDNAIQTGDELCKTFYVTSVAYGGTTVGANCTNGLANP